MPPIMPSYRQEARKRMRRGLKVKDYLEAPKVEPAGQGDLTEAALRIAASQGAENPTAVELASRTNTVGNANQGRNFRNIALGGREYHLYDDAQGRDIVPVKSRGPEVTGQEFVRRQQMIGQMRGAQQPMYADPARTPTGRNDAIGQGNLSNDQRRINLNPDAEMRQRVLERWIAEGDPRAGNVAATFADRSRGAAAPVDPSRLLAALRRRRRV